MNNLDRKKELECKLKSRGLELRTDSALCTKYIEGTIDLNIDYIVERMCQMKYLYEHCNMKKIKQDVYKEYLANNSRGVKLEANVSTRAEKIALDTYSNSYYPKIYPWEKSTNDKNIMWNWNLNHYGINNYKNILYFLGLISISLTFNLFYSKKKLNI